MNTISAYIIYHDNKIMDKTQNKKICVLRLNLYS